MAEFERDEHEIPQTGPSNASRTSYSANQGETRNSVSGHPNDASTMGPSSQGNYSNAPETVKETPNKIKSPLAAAAADREIALRVWTASLDRHDDVRDALGRMLGWVEELAALLHHTLKAKTELQTTLTVTQSNLALALSNTEMLEAALKRDASGRRVDVGWARSSAIYPPATAPLPANAGSPSASTPPIAKSETGFFKFLRNNGGSSTPPPGHMHRDSGGSIGMHTPHPSIDSPSSSTPNLHRAHSHLASPSMPSLHSTVSSVSKREAELAQALQRERESTSKALEEKRKLEEELESLSQALFEEANKMVATERMQRAQVEEELQNVRQEREALKGALRIVEGENSTLRSGAPAVARSHHASLSNASSASRDRPRALTIDTDRGQGDVAQISGIDLTQTPSTSELPPRSGDQTPVSTIETRPDIALATQIGNGPQDPNLRHVTTEMQQGGRPRRGTGESEGATYDHVPRSLTFGM
ncbi:hypothetical protein M408DRAFT_327724, partial [Serendipita vermifera MAFF 305830]